jgi:hypothetical protein
MAQVVAVAAGRRVALPSRNALRAARAAAAARVDAAAVEEKAARRAAPPSAYLSSTQRASSSIKSRCSLALEAAAAMADKAV